MGPFQKPATKTLRKTKFEYTLWAPSTGSQKGAEKGPQMKPFRAEPSEFSSGNHESLRHMG
ncbi:hypothetical protein CC1G_14650 [Coprinopsis cinerea okayama7|uniref:Uncharacterized protein n=1 Tax=Coprinopsis cinerea (strain Okayama-7 / 130 / ATCC MYA-4618 / FGSC 9003) TaxID=240176 RepID=D6RMI8_COPC7|nr:hypothetical protein CC1G_14650 [Coprinopsis cinerea okayama7\|eukprot:XP_002911221.1 hypothetical protein CC1G_14650 [Coprinopsis cinerea okayama7\